MEILLPNSNYKCKSLVDLLRYRAETIPNEIVYTFLSDGEGHPQTITYAELDQQAKAIAANLQKRLAPGERAILIYPPGLALIAAFFGCLYAGVVAVPTYPPESIKYIDKLNHIFESSKPKIVLSTTEFALQFNKLKLLKLIDRIPLANILLKQLTAKTIHSSSWNIIEFPWLTTDTITNDVGQQWRDPNINGEQIAFLQYTSGSTASPKGVILLHRNLLHNLHISNQGFSFNADDSFATWLPPYHDMGLIGSILEPLFLGTPCFAISPVHFLQKPLRWLQLISKYKVTVSGGPNFAYDYCAKKVASEQKAQLDLSHWQIAFNGAEPIRVKTMERFYEAFRECGFKKESFYPCYGLAEATLFVSGSVRNQGFKTCHVDSHELRNKVLKLTNKNDPHSRTFVSCGKPMQKIVIVNPETHKICQENEVGEIWINSPSVGQGYWDKESKEIFYARPLDDKNDTTYLRTGDLGFIYNNELYITGRFKDMIILYGTNYFPQDIEHTVADCHPLIRSGSCAAFAIVSDKEEHLVVVCELKPLSLDKEILSSICQVIYNAIMLHHEIRTHKIILVPAKILSKTTSGKIRRRHVKELVESHKLKVLYEWQRE